MRPKTKKNYTDLALLLYYREMLAYLLVNKYIALGIINGTITIVYRVVLYSNSKNILSGNIKTNEKQAFLKSLIFQLFYALIC